MKALALVDALVVSEIPQLVFVRESESHKRGGEFATPKRRKRREIALPREMSRATIRQILAGEFLQ